MNGIIHALTHLIVSAIGKKMKKPVPAFLKGSETMEKIRLPKYYLWVGVLSMVFFAALAVLSNVFPNGTESLWTTFVFTSFVLLGLSIVIAYVNWRIELYGVYFVYRTFFGRRYELLFSDIIRVKASENTIRVYMERKCFYVDLHAVGIESFLQKLPQMSGALQM